MLHYILIKSIIYKKEMFKMKIVLLNGSPNKNGNTYYLLSEIEKEIKKDGIETEIINVHEAVISARSPFCTVCSNPCSQACYKGTLLEEAFEKLTDADCVIIGSPVYFGTMSGQLKVFFDKSRIYRGTNTFAGKPAGIVSVGASKYGGEETTASSIIDTLQVQGFSIFNNAFKGINAGHKGVLAQRPAENDENAKALILPFAKRAVLEAKKYDFSKKL